jgi:hypothetical protein
MNDPVPLIKTMVLFQKDTDHRGGRVHAEYYSQNVSLHVPLTYLKHLAAIFIVRHVRIYR